MQEKFQWAAPFVEHADDKQYNRKKVERVGRIEKGRHRPKSGEADDQRSGIETDQGEGDRLFLSVSIQNACLKGKTAVIVFDEYGQDRPDES